MEQAVLERRVRVIPATKPAPASGPRHSGRQRVAAYCRVSTYEIFASSLDFSMFYD